MVPSSIRLSFERAFRSTKGNCDPQCLGGTMDSASGRSWTVPYSDDENFEIWCRDELFTLSMIRATALLECACDLHLSELYRSLGLASHLETAKTSSQLASELGYVESADIALEAMLLRLANRLGLVRVDFGCKSPRFIAARAGANQSAKLEAVRRDLAALGDGYAAAMKFLDFGAQNFVRSLRDDPDFMDRVLVGRERAFLPIWHRATNQDPLQDVHGKMGARLIDQIFDRGNVLEIGGGTGNGIRHLLRLFADHRCLSRLESYVFTDISLPFILGTKQEISKAYPTVNTQWRCLDINKPFRQQRLSPESFALIYGVNAAHIARDTVKFLQECHATTSSWGPGRLCGADTIQSSGDGAPGADVESERISPDRSNSQSSVPPGAWLSFSRALGMRLKPRRLPEISRSSARRSTI